MEGGGTEFPTTAPAAFATEVEQELNTAKTLYFEGLEKRVEATAAARELFERLLADASPTARPVIGVYLGSCELLEAGRWVPLTQKEALSRSGLRRMDDAAATVPDNLEVRFIRGMTCFNLPFFFGRSKTASEDLRFVAQRAVGAVNEGALSSELAAAACYFASKVAGREGDSVNRAKWLRDAAAIAPKTPAGRRAAEELEPGSP